MWYSIFIFQKKIILIRFKCLFKIFIVLILSLSKKELWFFVENLAPLLNCFVKTFFCLIFLSITIRKMSVFDGERDFKWKHFGRDCLNYSQSRGARWGFRVHWSLGVHKYLLMWGTWLKSCCYFLRGETQAMARLAAFQIRVGKQGSKELLSLLCNKKTITKDWVFRSI